jgi:transcriptional antiterminator NusG
MSDPNRDQEDDLGPEELSIDDATDNRNYDQDVDDTETSNSGDKGKTETRTSKQGEVAAAASQMQSDKPASDSRFFAIRTTGGQERMVADMLYTKVMSKKIGIRSVLVLDNFKGYIIVEAPDANVAYEGLAGIRHVRGQIRGDLPFKDIEGYLIKKPTVTELNIEDTVEVVAGPFKGMKAKITRVDYEKQEATVVLLDSPYQIPVTVDANYLKKAGH